MVEIIEMVHLIRKREIGYSRKKHEPRGKHTMDKRKKNIDERERELDGVVKHRRQRR